MQSWIYIFSKFTPEALLIEALLICLVSAGYAAYWLLKKRRSGVISSEVPAGVVKGYLNELIADAENMRAQLFGLLRSAGIEPKTFNPAGPAITGAMSAAGATAAAGATIAADPALITKIAQLENKMAEQNKAMHTLVSEKEQITKELETARTTRAAAAGGDDGSSQAIIADLQGKIKNLEARLAEYSIIEDDLANLKRLQQENAQLRASLGGAAPPPPAEPAAPPAAPAEANFDALASMVTATEANELTIPEPTAEALPEPLPEPATESLPEPTPVAEPAPEATPIAETAPEAPAPAPAAAAAAPPADQQSDADLVAEFEKMLNA